MGIEVLLIIAIVVVAGGIGFYVYTRSDTLDENRSGAPLSPPASSSSSEPERKKRKSNSPPVQQPQESTTPGGANSTLTGGTVDGEAIQGDIDPQADEDNDDIDDLDEFMEEPEEEEIPPLQPAIDDTQTMRAITKEDTQEMKELIQNTPKEMLPEEINKWMDDLAEEKEKMEGGEIVFHDPEPEAGEAVLDVDYPKQDNAAPPQPSKPVVTGSDDAPLATTAHFSAFYPKEAEAGKRYGVYVYAHAESMLEQITRDAAKFKDELGGTVPQPRTASDSKALAHGTQITVALESEEVEFEPDLLTKRWHGDWTRYEFEFRPKADLIDDTIFVRASIMVLGFEIAKIKFAIDVTAPQMQVMSRTADAEAPSNPFAKAKMESKMAVKYDKIFISYSRKDKLIAEAFKVIQEAAGNDVFFDVDDIRTGEDWQAAIARAIDEADYLQLFWSEHSAESEWCGYEWDYALNYRCKENKCREFIRPVWWTAPMPPPPDSLNHLNFRRFDFETLMKRDST